MSDDLVRQLEKAFQWSNDPMLSEAADEITALRARLEAVEGERDEQRHLRDHQCHLKLEAIARAERAEAALATARRDALEEAAKVCDKIVSDMIYFNDGARKKDKMFADRIRALANEAPG